MNEPTTLGRVFNVLGEPVDNNGPVAPDTPRHSIHRAAPKYDELASSTEILETGIKVIDLLAPYIRGGKIGQPGDVIPEINNALKIDKGNGQTLTVEVSLALGDGVVRTIAMDSTDGLQRGMSVTDTGAAIQVPVGDLTEITGGMAALE
ncbi:hypothetical protein GQS40_12225|uniref:ATPase F1/V1/A1 complex alpha/beta subunit N-terminal domain-containing protein n=1 Tax=Leuconostoc lactis TaxID=1246 RepID=A0A6L7ADL6_LEULA|nr:hypothetical protein [Leuconostoc lactis]